jgi:hypothetical protein
MSAAHIVAGLIDEFIPSMFEVFRSTSIDPKWLMEKMPERERVEGLHYLRLIGHLNRPITERSLDGLQICLHMAAKGLNPIEFILIGLRAEAPTLGKTARYIPSLPIAQFNGYGKNTESVMEKHFKMFGVPHSHLPSSTEAIERHIEHDKVLAHDAVLQTLLDCQTYPHHYAVGLPLSDPKARLFAVVFGSVKNLGYLAVSPLMRSCREAWFSELKSAPSDYQMGASSQFTLALSALEPHELFEELNASIRTWVLEMAQGLADPDINLQTHGSAAQAFGIDPIVQLGFALDERVEIASLMARTGNDKLSLFALRSLFKHSTQWVEVFQPSEIPEANVHRLFSCCLASYLMSISGSEPVMLESIQPLLEAYRQAFMTQGFSDIKGTRAMDGLVVHLDVAEGLERLGYLRREEMQMGMFFAPRHNQVPVDVTAPLRVRKMSLAMRLNQHETIAKAIDEFFSTQPGENLDLANPASVLHYLESGTQPIESLLNTRKKIQRALEAGIQSSVILECKKLKHFHEDVLGRDLGL